MEKFGRLPSAGKSGAGIIGLLIVVVIMMILTIMFFNPDEHTGKSAPKTYIDKAGNAACLANLTMAKTQIGMIQINSPGTVITTKMLEKMGNLPQCPDGGKYVYQNGELYCTKHFPPPATPEDAAATPAGDTSATQAMTPASMTTGTTPGAGLTN